MLSKDMNAFFVLLSNVAGYYRQQLAEQSMAIYWEGLKQFDFEAVKKAFNAHAQNPDSGQFMPKIADIVKYINGRTDDQAMIAWTAVDQAMQRVGPYSDVVFDDALIHRVLLDMGGWIYLSGKAESDWPFVQKEFVTRYRGFAIKGEVPDYPSRLVGISNAHNAQQGFPLLPPVFIGDRIRAQMILEGGSKRALIEMQSAGEMVKAIAMH